MKNAVYKGITLAKGSTALELYEAWQRETKDRNLAQKKLDQNMKDVEDRYNKLTGIESQKKTPEAKI